MARPRTDASAYQAVSVRFPKDILEQCRGLAKNNTRSLNEQMLHIVKRWMAGKGKDKHDVVGSTNN